MDDVINELKVNVKGDKQICYEDIWLVLSNFGLMKNEDDDNKGEMVIIDMFIFEEVVFNGGVLLLYSNIEDSL